MKKTILAACVAALTVFLCACPSAKTPVPGPAPSTPSALVVALDAMDIAAASAAPWFPGQLGSWMAIVAPTATQIAADLQQPNPFAQAQAIDATLQQVLASEPAVSTMSTDQQKAAASITGSIQAFLLLYEAQAGIAPAQGISAHAQRKIVLNSADLAILRSIANVQ